MIELVGLGRQGNAFPRQLSGGQQQRVGIARSLAVEPEIWFLDEPFSALDPLIRREMQDEFMRLQTVLHKTIVFITHDFDEAIRLADRIAIMKDGEIVQAGTPEDIVLTPATPYVAEFTRNVARAKVIRTQSLMARGEPIRKAGRTQPCPHTPISPMRPRCFWMASAISAWTTTPDHRPSTVTRGRHDVEGLIMTMPGVPPSQTPMRAQGLPDAQPDAAGMAGSDCSFHRFLAAAKPLVPAAFDYPKEHDRPLAKWISAFMKWLINEATFGLFSFTELTRFISAVLDMPYTLAAQPALHRVSGRQRLFGHTDRAALALDRRHRPGDAARSLARRHPLALLAPVAFCSWPYSGNGQRDGDAGIDPRRRPARRHPRAAVRHRRLALALARAGHHAASRSDADDPGLRLSGAGAVPVRLRPDGGRDCDTDLRHPADDPHRHSGACARYPPKSSILAIWSAAPNGR
jgi:hypothetical protein